VIIGVLKEIADGERRVGLVPEGVQALKKLGVEVLVEIGAGVEVGAGIGPGPRVGPVSVVAAREREQRPHHHHRSDTHAKHSLS